jgi:hypothetical protein
MLAKPTNPFVRTTFDLRVNRPDGTAGVALFQGWGVNLPDSMLR